MQIGNRSVSSKQLLSVHIFIFLIIKLPTARLPTDLVHFIIYQTLLISLDNCFRFSFEPVDHFRVLGNQIFFQQAVLWEIIQFGSIFTVEFHVVIVFNYLKYTGIASMHKCIMLCCSVKNAIPKRKILRWIIDVI